MYNKCNKNVSACILHFYVFVQMHFLSILFFSSELGLSMDLQLINFGSCGITFRLGGEGQVFWFMCQRSGPQDASPYLIAVLGVGMGWICIANVGWLLSYLGSGCCVQVTGCRAWQLNW